MARPWARVCLLWLASMPGPALAHDADVIFVQVEARGGAVDEVLTLTAQTLGALAPVDADADGLLTQADLDASLDAQAAGVWAQARLSAGGVGCALATTAARLEEGFVRLQARWACGPGELRQDFRLLAVLPPNYRVEAGKAGQLARPGGFAQLPQTSLTLRPAPAAARPAAPTWPWGLFLAAALLLVLFERRSK